MLNINDVAVSAPSFDVQVVNDTPILDFPRATNIDFLQVAAGDLVPAEAAMFPNIDAANSDFRMTLYAPIDTLDLAGIPEAASKWNQFNLWREIHVGFANGEGGAIGFQATVGDFRLIPEPTTGFLTLFSLIALIILRSQRFRHT